MFQSVEDNATKVGIYLQVVNLNVVNFWLVQGRRDVHQSAVGECINGDCAWSAMRLTAP